MVSLGLNIEDCLRNVLRNHGWHAMFLDNLWITIVVVMTTNPEKHLQKAFFRVNNKNNNNGNP